MNNFQSGIVMPAGSGYPVQGKQSSVTLELKYIVSKYWLAVTPKTTSRHNIFGVDSEFGGCFNHGFPIYTNLLQKTHHNVLRFGFISYTIRPLYEF